MRAKDNMHLQETVDELHTLFYTESGKLYLKESGNEVGRLDCGYISVSFNGVTRRVHRVIFALTNGVFNGHIDHINGVKTDNRPENLRICTQGLNTANSRKRSDNTSGYKGVTWHKLVNKWASQTMFNGKRVHLGCYEDKREAALVYNYKLEELFGKDCVFNSVFEDVPSEVLSSEA